MEGEKGVRAPQARVGRGLLAGWAGSAAARLLIAASVLLNAVMPASVGVARAAAPDSASFAVKVRPNDIWPPRGVTDLAGMSGAEGQAYLEWTAPDENVTVGRTNTPVSQYLIRVATFSVAELAGDTTAWFNAATVAMAPPPSVPGSRQALLTSLSPGQRYYFGVKSRDDAGLVSDVDDNAKSGTNQAKVDVVGIAGITNLTALSGAAEGTIDLVWTEPRRVGQLDPTRYEVRVSTLGQIANNGQFLAAKPLTAFSPSTVPSPGPAGSTRVFTITGLTPSATYYFAVRTADAGAPPFTGTWVRNPAVGLNVFNSARAMFTPALPEPVTNLTGLYGFYPGDIYLTWTAPRNTNNVPMERYILKVSSRSIAQLGGDTEAWFDLAESTTVIVSPLPPGTTVSVNLTGFNGEDMGKTFYFGLKSVDIAGETSPIDVRAATVVDQASTKPKPTPPIINLTATPGAASGSVDLTWTEPDSTGNLPPFYYRIHVSTTANIEDNGGFDAAKPLTAFSSTPIPAAGAGGASVLMTVTGLIPNVTYYFGIREYDSNLVPIVSDWLRDPASGVNMANFAAARFIFNRPDRITDLTALTGAAQGEVGLSWTAPRNQNFVPVSTYTVRMATFSVAQAGGDAERWYDIATDERVLAPAKTPASRETLTVTGLDAGVLYFFGVKSLDREAELSLTDVRSQGVTSQARAASRGVGPVTDLYAQPDPAASFGGVQLSWTEPVQSSTTAPMRYVVKASSIANITTDAEFAAAEPVTSLSGTPLPGVGAAGARLVWVLTGLTPFTTYYFALRAEDSSAPVMKGRWLREVSRSLNAFNSTQPRFVPNDPESITDLAAAQGALTEGDVQLSWTAPLNRNFVPIASYEIRYSTRSVADLAGDAALWYGAAQAASKSGAGSPGTLETLTLNSLYPSSTFYFAVKSVDKAAEVSGIDTKAASPALQAYSKPLNLPPATPAGLSAEAGLIQVSLKWDELPAGLGGKGLDFKHYFLQRSTEEAAGFAEFSTTTAVSLLDRPLDAFTTFYFKLGARDSEGLVSPLSSAVKATPFTISPMEPFSFDLSRATDVVTLRWGPTVRFRDSTPFTSTTSPRTDELTGYQVFLTTNPCIPYTLVQSSGIAVGSFTHDTRGRDYFYMMHSTNAWFRSLESYVLTDDGDRYYGLDDCKSAAVVLGEEAELLKSENTGLAEDIAILRQRLPEETGDRVLQAAEFLPMLGGHTEVQGFHFPKPVKIRLHFVTDGTGSPVAQAAGFGAADALGQKGTLAAAAAAGASQNLGIFWDNGTEYKKLYGKVDPVEQTVEAETPNLGRFQIRVLQRGSEVLFDGSNLTSRVVTPNGDGKNDLLIFTFDDKYVGRVSGKVYDIRGAYVSELQAGSARGLAANTLTWDGMMNGKPATSGVYIYQIEADGKVYNGSVVVAR